MDIRSGGVERIPRVAPTPNHRRAMVGVWELDGERVLMLAEPDTGVLVARNNQGRKVNPLRVITRGRKCEKDCGGKRQAAS